MNVYWGYGASGKSNLEYQHLYGGKSFSWIGKFCARTRSGTVHLTGLQNNKKWWDYDVTNTIWHKRKDEDKVRTVSNTQRRLDYIKGCPNEYLYAIAAIVGSFARRRLTATHLPLLVEKSYFFSG